MKANVPHIKRSIFLSDDDSDDCTLFSEALMEITGEANLTVSNDGARLMQLLEDTPPAPEIIFLDLNMPRKNGFECLQEIRQSPKLRDIPVVIFSTSSNSDVVERMFEGGANFYITKPASYNLLKKAIAYVLSLDSRKLQVKPLREQFVIKVA
ncbi:response regulator [Flavobacterium silvaticum]|uniref:Response regulator n=1 Tax=Flavobacterium silvaticum TaxID=1852020 RepID=A0A972FVI8_9FLAO|nr:response regulator [Flavobacterium silvaticum]NMH28807.1 response regulator [Flavobacterium silvaticum]